jgi:hypothetical protein
MGADVNEALQPPMAALPRRTDEWQDHRVASPVRGGRGVGTENSPVGPPALDRVDNASNREEPR